ncbi:MAG: hypothetical protein ACRES8_07010 [Nevskiaceae bacterium]
MNRTSSLAAALVLSTLAGTASASDSLPSRAVSAVGIVIASQGNAALVQIRRELGESARDAMKPFLPAPQKAPEQPQPATPPVAQR